MKKRYYIIIAIILFIGVNTYLVYNLINNKEVKYEEKEENTSNMKILVDNVEAAAIPPQDSGYILDSVSCDKEGSNVWFDYINWKVGINTSKTNKCTLKFKKGENTFLKAMLKDTSMVAYDDFGNLRYIGADPHNYIWFNCDTYSGLTKDNAIEKGCERWRIIGLMNNVETEKNGTQNLVKIIRDEPLPNYYVWDNKPSGKGSSLSSDGSNDWTDSRLMMLLNPGYSTNQYNATGTTGSLYWDRQGGQCSGTTGNGIGAPDGTKIACNFSTEGLKGDDTGPTKSMIESAKWKLGGLTSYDNVTTSQFYSAERGSTVPSNRKTEWIGKIGLMYPSDYGYATGGKGNGSGTYTREQCLAYRLYGWNSGTYKTDCAEKDWLYDSSKWQWTLTPVSSYSYGVFFVISTGDVTNGSAFASYTVRPTLYLTSNTMISSGEGDGSSTNPYILIPG